MTMPHAPPLTTSYCFLEFRVQSFATDLKVDRLALITGNGAIATLLVDSVLYGLLRVELLWCASPIRSTVTPSEQS